MGSPSSSARLTLLPSNYLSSQNPSSEITLQSLIDVSDRMANEAKEALPYNFDECSYSKGYLRQSVWSCLDCGEKGVCYGCSISCHSEHRLVELWTKRSFRCDCPTVSMQAEQPSGSKRRKCVLNRPETQPQLPNEKNRYSKNFQGKFCRCGRDYDPETEEEAMLCCLGCEDWFHETCLNLRQPADKTSNLSQPLAEDPQLPTLVTAPDNAPSDLATEEGEEEEGEGDEQVLIPSDTYDSLICGECVLSNSFLTSQAGKEGFMIIEPRESSWVVVGRDIRQEDEVTVGLGKKRGLEESRETSKRVKLDDGSEARERDAFTDSERRKGKGDIFLAHGVRNRLKFQLDTDTISSLPFPLEDEEIYEPPQDVEQEETIEEATSRVVSSLPRIQAIEALYGYQRLKEQLNDMLRSHVQSGKTVSKEDIEELFEKLKATRERR
ncbi:E3 ubiquitin-protein ligase UBR7 [Cryptococcus neoformans Tu401-1]|nr:E3 ubiquitin-protein ligase UBR7 [Cryptococcus neoformans var. grubii Bt85]OXG22177.1 E3 ubiquitin-protein ligase UBR7 [Cryptococcus neoformans var. grubii Tu401-1]OXM81215.1 E3 ubiquitin-protein ligase UBR7 [Cryptococcus neoformans var. grubii Bt63]